MSQKRKKGKNLHEKLLSNKEKKYAQFKKTKNERRNTSFLKREKEKRRKLQKKNERNVFQRSERNNFNIRLENYNGQVQIFITLIFFVAVCCPATSVCLRKSQYFSANKIKEKNLQKKSQKKMK